MEFHDFYTVKCTTDRLSVQFESLMGWLAEPDSKRIITFLNPHVFNTCLRDPVVARVINTSDLVCMDGTGIKLGFMIGYRTLYRRTIMTYLFDRVINDPGLPKLNAVLIGTTSTEVERAARRINKLNGPVSVVNFFSGFHSEEFYISELSLMKDIRVVLIGMSTPVSEHLIHKLSQLDRNLILWHIGGGTIKCYANTKRRSPDWLSSMGLEWLHRIVFEPHLVRRYLLGIPRFMLNIFILWKQLRKQGV